MRFHSPPQRKLVINNVGNENDDRLYITPGLEAIYHNVIFYDINIFHSLLPH